MRSTRSMRGSRDFGSGSSTNREISGPHIKLFVNAELARDLAVTLPHRVEVMIVGALSGG
jgi:hypothetical protein